MLYLVCVVRKYFKHLSEEQLCWPLHNAISCLVLDNLFSHHRPQVWLADNKRILGSSDLKKVSLNLIWSEMWYNQKESFCLTAASKRLSSRLPTILVCLCHLLLQEAVQTTLVVWNFALVWNTLLQWCQCRLEVDDGLAGRSERQISLLLGKPRTRPLLGPVLLGSSSCSSWCLSLLANAGLECSLVNFWTHKSIQLRSDYLRTWWAHVLTWHHSTWSTLHCPFKVDCGVEFAKCHAFPFSFCVIGMSWFWDCSFELSYLLPFLTFPLHLVNLVSRNQVDAVDVWFASCQPFACPASTVLALALVSDQLFYMSRLL